MFSLCFASGAGLARAAGAQAPHGWLLRGTEMATPVYLLDSGRPGPVVLMVGAIHGDEPAGSAALQRLLGERPAQGKWVLIPVANRRAFEAAERTPYDMPDLNRSFPGNPRGPAAERLAAALMATVKRYRPTLVLDLHEAAVVDAPGGNELANTLILSEEGQAARIALGALESLPPTPSGRPFSFLSGAPTGSFNRTVASRFGIPVITVETDRRDALEQRVDTQIGIVRRLLAAAGAPLP